MSARLCALLGFFLSAGSTAAYGAAHDSATAQPLPVATAQARVPSHGALPRGHWQGDDSEPLRLCLDVQDESSLLITFRDRRLRHPVVVEADYAFSQHPKEQASLVLTVRRIVTKEIGPCRRFWIRQDLPSYDGLGLSLHPGSKLRLRLTFSCQNEVSKVELCFEPDHPSGAKRPPICQKLSSPGHSHCQPAAPTSVERILPL